MAMLYVLRRSRWSILVLTARLRRAARRASRGCNNAGPHGLTEILYAFTSTPANNGSAFAGLTAVDLLLQHPVRPGDADRPLRA